LDSDFWAAAASGEVVWRVCEVSGAPGSTDSAAGDEVDRFVSLFCEVSGCGGKGVLGAGVVLQAASPSPARKVDINIRNLILFGDIFKRKIDSGCHQNEMITVSNIRFCQSCVKPAAGIPGHSI
jgi:hypothetical protein